MQNLGIFTFFKPFAMRTILPFIVLLISLAPGLKSQPGNFYCQENTAVPFSVDETNLTVWNGQEYQPVFLKAMNLGVAVPGTFPGHLAATRDQYSSWIARMKEIGYNAIRLYTLHYPRFYEVLDSFNLARPHSPMLLLQGVWLEEELEGYEHDLHFLTDTFDLLAEETVDCMHGNKVIPPRFGKAYGTYDTDVSPWVMAYIMGREVYPTEVLTTDALHPGDSSFSGQAFTLPAGSPTESWITARLDNMVLYERTEYQTERPMSFSSWPTLDPMRHPAGLFPDEDTAQVDLANLQFTNAPAGCFASYHAYPYYPDFISREPEYQSYFDHIGPNSYLGYLNHLKSHYHRFPLIIAEYGTPSSWGIAHYAQSGMHHGGFSEQDQGYNYLRILHNIQDAGCGGGAQFSWIDEWFKRTWITDPIDFNPESRILWQNIMAAEQNFGLIGFKKQTTEYQTVASSPGQPVTEISAARDYEFLHLKLMLGEHMTDIDTLWLAIDSYAETLGESILPSGDTVTERAEFCLKITNFSAELFVTRAYDLFGIWHYISGPEQLYHSIPTDGEPWKLVRWKNSDPDYEIQYVGALKVNRFDFPPNSLDAIVMGIDSIDIRIPWSLLQFTDPSHMRVIHDYRDTPQREDTISDGLAFTAFFHQGKTASDVRYAWNDWNFVEDTVEVEKASMAIVEADINDFNNPPIAFCDEYIAQQRITLMVDENNGVMQNDYDLDGDILFAELTVPPANGTLELFFDGSFLYTSCPDFYGEDLFSYRVYDGQGHSDTCMVRVIVEGNQGLDQLASEAFSIYPNPARNVLNIETPETDAPELEILSISGQQLLHRTLDGKNSTLNISGFPVGVYLVNIQTENSTWSERMIVY